MSLKAQVYAQALTLAGRLAERQETLLEILCAGAVSSLTARLREQLTPEDCREEFIAAASLLALAALGRADTGGIQEFRAGDLTVKQGSGEKSAASRCLEQQAERLLGPYLRDRFTFTGV